MQEKQVNKLEDLKKLKSLKHSCSQPAINIDVLNTIPKRNSPPNDTDLLNLD